MEKDNGKGFGERLACYLGSSLRLIRMALRDKKDKGSVVLQIDGILQRVGDLEEAHGDNKEIRRLRKRVINIAKELDFSDSMIEECLFLGREHRRLGKELGFNDMDEEMQLVRDYLSFTAEP